MKNSLRRHSALLLLFCVFVPMRPTYGQTSRYEALRSAGSAENRAGHYVKAEALLLGALEEALLEKDECAVAAVHNDLGATYQNTERRVEAERSYSKALSIFRRMPGKNYETAHMLRNLGSVYSVTRRESGALTLFQEALKLLTKKTSDEQGLTAHILNAMGVVYFQQGKMSRSETALIQAMRIRSAGQTDSDLIDAQIQNNLGAIYQKQRKYAKAEESHRRSLEITERLLGPLHPYVAAVLSNLGIVYTESRRHKEAIDSYRRGLAILEQTGPVPEGRIVATLRSLAKIYLVEGEKAGADALLARAVEIARRNPLPDPVMPMLLEAHADVLISLGKAEQAGPLRAEARRMRTTAALTVRVRKPN